MPVPRSTMLLTVALVQTWLLDHVVNMAACAVLVEAIANVDGAEFPEPLETFMGSYREATDRMELRRAHSADRIMVPGPLGLPHDQDVLFRNALRVPVHATNPFQLQADTARMLTSILAHVLTSATWNVVKNGGSCCDQCSVHQPHQVMTDCRGLASELVLEEADIVFPTCTSCYAQGLRCTWPTPLSDY